MKIDPCEQAAQDERDKICTYIRKRLSEKPRRSRDAEDFVTSIHNEIEQGKHCLEED